MAAGRAAAFSLTRHPLTPRILSFVLSRGPILAVGSGPVHFRFTPFRSCSGNSNDCSSALKSRRRKFGHWSLDSFALWSGVDYEHWFVGMDKPGGEGATKQQMIDCYVKTLAQVVGSEEEAKKKIYRVRCDPKKQQLGFYCKADWNARYKLQELPGVVGTLPECDPNDEERGGKPFSCK